MHNEDKVPHFVSNTYICDVLSFFRVLLTGSSLSGINIWPVADARELLVFLPVFMGGSGGGSPLWVADEFFDRLSWLFERFVTFCGMTSFSLLVLPDVSDETDFDLKHNFKRWTIGSQQGASECNSHLARHYSKILVFFPSFLYAYVPILDSEHFFSINICGQNWDPAIQRDPAWF